MTMRQHVTLREFALFLILTLAMGAAAGAGAAPAPGAEPDDLVRIRASIRYYMTGEYGPEVGRVNHAHTTLESIRDEMMTGIYPGQTDTPEVWGEVCQFYEYLFAQDEGTRLATQCDTHLSNIVRRAQRSAAAASLDVERRLRRAVRDWFIRRDERITGWKETFRDPVEFVGLRLWVAAASDVRLPVEKRRKLLLFLLRTWGSLVIERDTRGVLPSSPYPYTSLALWSDWRFLLEALRAEADADPAFALEVAKALPEADVATTQAEPYLGFFVISGQTGPARDFLGRLLRLDGLTEAKRATIEKLRNNLKKVPVVKGWLEFELVDGDAAVRKWIIPRLEAGRDALLAQASVLGQRLLEDCLRELKDPNPEEPLIDIYMRYLYKAWIAGYAWPPVPHAFDEHWPYPQDPGG